MTAGHRVHATVTEPVPTPNSLAQLQNHRPLTPPVVGTAEDNSQGMRLCQRCLKIFRRLRQAAITQSAQLTGNHASATQTSFAIDALTFSSARENDQLCAATMAEALRAIADQIRRIRECKYLTHPSEAEPCWDPVTEFMRGGRMRADGGGRRFPAGSCGGRAGGGLGVIRTVSWA